MLGNCDEKIKCRENREDENGTHRRTVVLLVSSSRFLLEGISNVIEIKNDNIEIVTKASNENIEEFITQTNPKFVFIDNRTNRA